MGAIRTKLESYKQPKQPRSPRGRVSVQRYGPAKGSNKSSLGSDLKGAFWMARALQKDEQSAQSSQAMADASATRLQGTLDNAASLGKVLDQLNLEADNLLSSLPSE